MVSLATSETYFDYISMRDVALALDVLSNVEDELRLKHKNTKVLDPLWNACASSFKEMALRNGTVLAFRPIRWEQSNDNT